MSWVFRGLKGVVIVQVKPGSVTAQAGIQSGDVITKVGQTKVDSLEAFEKVIDDTKLEDGILLQVRRGNSTKLVLLQSE